VENANQRAAGLWHERWHGRVVEALEDLRPGSGGANGHEAASCGAGSRPSREWRRWRPVARVGDIRVPSRESWPGLPALPRNFLCVVNRIGGRRVLRAESGFPWQRPALRLSIRKTARLLDADFECILGPEPAKADHVAPSCSQHRENCDFGSSATRLPGASGLNPAGRAQDESNRRSTMPRAPTPPRPGDTPRRRAP
jgi:hypothetical protein